MRWAFPFLWYAVVSKIASHLTEALSREVTKGPVGIDTRIFKLGTRRWWSASGPDRFTPGGKGPRCLAQRAGLELSWIYMDHN
jgi:hypothetical protein